MIRLKRLAKNPLVIIVPLVAVALFSWNAYVKASNKPNHAEYNLLQNGSFDTFDDQGRPHGWSVEHNDSITYRLSREKGFGSGEALGINIRNYEQGSLELRSPIVSVQQGAHYLYKGYYTSDVPFSLLVRYIYKDGTTQLRLVKEYEPSKDWSTSSLTFSTDDEINAVQILYRVASKGNLRFDRAYVEERSDTLYVEESDTGMPNLINNGNLAVASASDPNEPDGWTPFKVGDHTAVPLYIHDDHSAFLRTTVSDYRSGEAKWDHKPILVGHGSYSRFSVDYRSSAPVYIVAEYALDDRTRTFVRLTDLPPADEWTRTSVSSEAPPRAVEVTFHVVIAAPGTVDTDNYAVNDMTRQGVRLFNRPLVSLTFDDGWSSDYTTVDRILSYLSYKGTFYINPDALDQPQFLTSSQLDKLVDHGHQVASGGYEYLDLTTLNARQLDRQLRLGNEYFTREYGLSQVDFAPPKGEYDPEIRSKAMEYYRSARTTDEGINTKQTLDPYSLRTLYMDAHTSPQRLEDALREATRQSGWLILVYKRVEDGHPNRTTVTASSFAEQLELIRRSGITVKTVEGALDEIRAQQ